MKWFWYSLIGFCVLMCSCKTKSSAHLINEASKENIQTEWTKFQAVRDTSSVLRIDIDKSKLTIVERIKVTEYDAESGKPIKETETERKIAQDSDKVVAEEGQERVESRSKDSLNHFRDTTEKMESEVKEESIGGQEAFGKWFGITIGCGIIVGIFILIAYLWRKFRK